VPTYFFIVSILTMLGLGAWRHLTGAIAPAHELAHPAGATQLLTTFALLTAFSNGCTAMTGVEAVSNGVPAFRPPESRNAASTLVAMGVLSIVMFMGITLLAHAYALVPNDSETVISQLARATFGGDTAFYFAAQAATMLILVLAANTAYADFPRLASIVARDRFLPRQFTNQGDRLAFSNGILILSVLAAALLVAFAGRHARAHPALHDRRLRLLHAVAGRDGDPLAAVGGAGLAGERVRQRRRRARHGVVLVIVAVTKAAEGAWLILLMIPALVALFTITTRHYDHVASELTLRDWRPEVTGRHVVLVPIGGIQRAVVKALQYARTLSPDVRAVYVEMDPAGTEALRREWPEWGQGVDLAVLASPYRSLLRAAPRLHRRAQTRRSGTYITVILPEFVPSRLWQHLLHNQHALLIKGALLFKPNVVVTACRFISAAGARSKRRSRCPHAPAAELTSWTAARGTRYEDAGNSMAGVFISYRREDAPGHAGRVLRSRAREVWRRRRLHGRHRHRRRRRLRGGDRAGGRRL
jgi:hypothetical protein